MALKSNKYVLRMKLFVKQYLNIFCYLSHTDTVELFSCCTDYNCSLQCISFFSGGKQKLLRHRVHFLDALGQYILIYFNEIPKNTLFVVVVLHLLHQGTLFEPSNVTFFFFFFTFYQKVFVLQIIHTTLDYFSTKLKYYMFENLGDPNLKIQPIPVELDNICQIVLLQYIVCMFST